MSRRRVAKKKIVNPDSLYNDVLVAKFINVLMFDGKKVTAENILYSAMNTAEQKLNVNALEVFKKALENVRPLVDVRSRRVGGATYQVPMDVSHDHSMIMGMRFLVHSARKRSGNSMINKLLFELMDAYNNKGNAVKLREDKHKVAEANKAFSQFRW